MKTATTKKQFLITKISKHLLYAMLAVCVFGGLFGCENAHLESPLIVTSVRKQRKSYWKVQNYLYWKMYCRCRLLY